MQNETTKEGNHYVVPMLWKPDHDTIPCNRSQSLSKLTYLKARLDKNPQKRENYQQGITEMIQSGFARRVPNDYKSMKPKWYMPHHPVQHPRKDKDRIVFNCAAEYGGQSLNKCLLRGLDFLNALIGVLFRFRLFMFAVVSDIKGMFNQVLVPEQDKNALRFLWIEKNEVVEYQMNVHVFGATSSPSCAMFALSRTMDDNLEILEGVDVLLLKLSFYIDDFLRSFATEREAIDLIPKVKNALLNGGFELRKWNSNSNKVNNFLPQEARNIPTSFLNSEKNQSETHVLGIKWDSKTDSFSFDVSIKPLKCTRRNILSTFSIIFDPHGFLSPFILKPKIILQEMTKLKLSWDQERSNVEWDNWLKETEHLHRISIPRCLVPSANNSHITLHHFSDASLSGYGCVSYLRCEDQSTGKVNVAFVSSKARVTPIKQTTIPRLELTAAVLATKQDLIIKEELTEVSFQPSVFWTDSECVLKYLNNSSNRYPIFEGNRISAILQRSNCEQWHHVVSSKNVADAASRGLGIVDLENGDWFTGPKFLQQPKLKPMKWTSSKSDPPEPRNFAVNINNNSELSPVLRAMERLSNWHKAKRYIAIWLRYIKIIRDRVNHEKRELENFNIPYEFKTLNLTVEELQTAEIIILKDVQKHGFAESTRISSEKPSRKKSPLAKLNPVMDNYGLIRSESRLKLANLEFDTVKPIILPKGHVSQMIIRQYHYSEGHCGQEHLLCTLRRRYFILGARRMIKKMTHDCVKCKKLFGRTATQIMAPLPTFRTTPPQSAFSYVGTDCFGPFYIKIGRARHKRWGVLFTCLSSRAVHIEVLQDLSTSSFINALRRFIARRGRPAHIYSDNGTNYVGAEKELRTGLADWNNAAISEHLLKNEIQWHFNTPTASSHGGVWERIVKSICSTP